MPKEHSSREGAAGETTAWHATGSNEEVQQLRGALSRLNGTQIGQVISAAIRERGMTTRFRQIEENAVACFDPERNEIVVDDSMRNASLEILAAHLAHEGTHVQWDRANSIDQEYHAFRAQAEVWNQLKEDQTNTQCDLVSRIIALGEQDAKDLLISYMYPELPEYA